jgi:hypothetical protein
MALVRGGSLNVYRLSQRRSESDHADRPLAAEQQWKLGEGLIL